MTAPIIPLKPSDSICERTIGLNPAGKPYRCRRVDGNVRVGGEGGPVLCRHCLELSIPELEELALEPEGREDCRKAFRKKRRGKA